ncbi:MAG: rhodanese-like domain-containing protein, partial [Anaerolineae bacterium]
MSNKIVAILVLVAVVLDACQAAPAPTWTMAQLQKTVLTPRASGSDSVPLTREEVPRISPDQLRDLLASARRVVVVDTRSYSEYQAGHIRGAISLPGTEIESRYRELSKVTQIVLYCA